MRYQHAAVPGATCCYTHNAADRKGQILLNHVQLLLAFPPFTPTYNAVRWLGGAGPHVVCAAAWLIRD